MAIVEKKKRNKTKIVLTIIFILLIAGLVKTGSDLITLRSAQKAQNSNTKVLDFNIFFIESVLQAEGEIDFETRLKLEGAVRDLNDLEILAAWNTFVKAPNDDDAQTALKELLLLLARKARD